jgi:hypothetical protein
MWLLWLVPLPALRKENRPAIRSVDLWCVTVYGPAKMEQASPWKPPQLAKKTEFSAEDCLPRTQPWPTKQSQMIVPSVIFEPLHR